VLRRTGSWDDGCVLLRTLFGVLSSCERQAALDDVRNSLASSRLAQTNVGQYTDSNPTHRLQLVAVIHGGDPDFG
jgi:hypothetical protein